MAFSTLQTPQPSHIEFNLLYEAAKNLKRDAVSALLDKDGICIDVLDNRGLLTVAGKIAREGKTNPDQYKSAEEKAEAQRNLDAIMLLLEFGANPGYVGAGAAASGDRQLAEKCRTEMGADINMMAFGAALGKRYGYATWLHENYGALRSQIVYGMAMNGDLDGARALATKISDRDYCPELIFGAVVGGHHVFVRAEISEQRVTSPDMIALVICLSAMAGFTLFADELRNVHKVPIDLLGKYAMKGGHKSYVNQLQGHFQIKLLDLIEGAAESGRLNDAYQFGPIKSYDNEKQKFLLEGARKRGQKTVEAKLRQQLFSAVATNLNEEVVGRLTADGYLTQAVDIYMTHYYTTLNVLFSIVRAMVKSKSFANEKLTLHKLSFIDHHDFLRALAGNLNRVFNRKWDHKSTTTVSNVTPGEFYENFNYLGQVFDGHKHFVDIERIAETAIKINQAMRKYHLDYDQATAFVKHEDELRYLFMLLPRVQQPVTQYNITLIAGLTCLNLQASQSLLEKLSLAKLKYFFLADVVNYLEGKWIAHRERAGSVLSAAKATTTRAEFKALLKYQKDLFDGVAKPQADTSKPKHEQPLTKLTKDDFAYSVAQHHQRIIDLEVEAEKNKAPTLSGPK